jgi:hypothetical protein
MKFIILAILGLIFFSVRPPLNFLSDESNVVQDSDSWDSKTLNTGQSVSYLTTLEKEVLLELNKVRSDPPRYATLYISPILNELRGRLNTRSNVETKEGAKAVEECIAQLLRTNKMGLLDPDKDLAKAAFRHTSKQSKTREIGHNSPDGETFEHRLRKIKYSITGECISYGEDKARDIVTSLLVDDGVPSRGHRKIVLDPRFSCVGISAGGHLVYSHMCTIDFAGDQTIKR